MEDCNCHECLEMKADFLKDPLNRLQPIMFQQLVHHPEMIPNRLAANTGADMARNHFRQIVKSALLFEKASIDFDDQYLTRLTVGLYSVWKEFSDKNLIADCTVCLKPTAICCSKCLITAYCNKDCQLQHWNKIHKHMCKHIAVFVKKMKEIDNEIEKH